MSDPIPTDIRDAPRDVALVILRRAERSTPTTSPRPGPALTD
jgi:hypothetical protein